MHAVALLLLLAAADRQRPRAKLVPGIGRRLPLGRSKWMRAHPQVCRIHGGGFTSEVAFVFQHTMSADGPFGRTGAHQVSNPPLSRRYPKKLPVIWEALREEGWEEGPDMLLVESGLWDCHAARRRSRNWRFVRDSAARERWARELGVNASRLVQHIHSRYPSLQVVLVTTPRIGLQTCLRLRADDCVSRSTCLRRANSVLRSVAAVNGDWLGLLDFASVASSELSPRYARALPRAVDRWRDDTHHSGLLSRALWGGVFAGLRRSEGGSMRWDQRHVRKMSLSALMEAGGAGTRKPVSHVRILTLGDSVMRCSVEDLCATWGFTDWGKAPAGSRTCKNETLSSVLNVSDAT